MPLLARHSPVALWHPELVVILLGVLQAYRILTGPLRERWGWGGPVGTGQKLRFAAGLISLYIAAGSPLHLIGEYYLMTGHMLTIMLLTLAVPPFLITGIPAWLWERILAPRPVAAAVAFLTRPAAALALFNGLFVFWHVPGVFDAALRNGVLHLLQYGTLVLAGLAAWWPLLGPLPRFPRLSEPGQMVHCFLWMVLQTFLFSPFMVISEPMYAVYRHAPRLWPISALDDQYLGHMLMNLASVLVVGSFFTRAFVRWAQREGGSGRPRPTPEATAR